MEEKRWDAGTLATVRSSAGGSADSPASEPTSTRRRAGALKRKANAVSASSNSTSTSSKGMMTRDKLMLFSQPPVHNGPLTRARQAPNNLASAPAVWAAGVKQEQENAAADAKDGARPREEEEINKAMEEWEALEAKIEAEFEAIRSRESNAHVVPNHCGWFSWTKIHPLEERSLPSFFNGKVHGRTPGLYMEIRNWIVKKFHAEPNIQIELKDLSELEVGDLDAKQEVMEFLDYWGLINFQPFPPTDSNDAVADGDEAEENDSLVEKLYRFQATQSCPNLVPKPHITTQAMPSGLLPEFIVADDLLKQEGPSVEYHCNSCSADCSRKRYHCPKQADFDLCTECFNGGKFGSDMSSSDFILMEPAEAPGVGSGKWTDQETLLLLEAVELFKENWNEIAEHVATKTKAQCMLHFLQMPIEDAFLDHDDDKDASSKETAELAATDDNKSVPKDAPDSTEGNNDVSDGETLGSPMETSEPEDASEGKSSQKTSRAEDVSEVKIDQKISKPSSANDGKCEDETGENMALKALREAFEDVGYPLTPESPLSFADVGNPVMALAAFLARLVGSDVATASARASLKSIDSSSPGLWLAARHSFLLEDPPDDKKESAAFESAVAEMNHKNNHKDEELVSPTDESTVKSDAPREPRKNKEGKTGASKEPTVSKFPNALASEVPPSTLKDTGGETLEKVHKESPKDVDTLPKENKETRPVTMSESADDDASEPMQGSKDVDMADSFPPEKNESQEHVKIVGEDVSHAKEGPEDVPVALDASVTQHSVASASVSENGGVAGEDQDKSGERETHVGEGTKDERNIEKLKRAAVSALSAVAVKAKLLAKQEEDQIRQLSISLIEKQLHKLETKLIFYNEMEGMIMRVRDQLERSRQRLYHERAQIIAARLGVPASSSSKASLPTNRIAANFANAVPRPPMGMGYSRPPMPRSMGMVPSTSNSLASITVTGSTGQPSGLDKVSSV